MTEPLCYPSDVRLLGNIGFLATKMQWREEAETIYRALESSVHTKAELYFTWLSARCEFGDLDGACEVMARLESLPGVPSDMVAMARCYLQCCANAPEWVDNARRIVRAGPDAFGYETARAMLEEHDLRNVR